MKTPLKTLETRGNPLFRTAIVSGSILALLALPLLAGVSIPIANAGFESPTLTNGDYTDPDLNNGAIPDWTEINAADGGVWNITTDEAPSEAPEGSNVAWLNASFGPQAQGFKQVLSGSGGLLQGNCNYTLTTKVSACNSGSGGLAAYQIQLLAGGIVLAQDNNTLGAGASSFVTSTVTYTHNPADNALVGQPLEIRVSYPPDVPAGRVLMFDDVRLTADSPSPYATWSGGAAFDDDANGDGVKNGLAWLLGAPNKDVSALGNLPKVSQSGGSLVLTFDRLSSADSGGAELNVQHSSDLGLSDPWAEVPVAGTAPLTVTAGGVDFVTTTNGALIHVVATIPLGNAVAGKSFGRLNAKSQ